MKYIIFDDYEPILFPSSWEHASVANKFPQQTPTSAGFFKEGQVSGWSQSLKLQPKEKDQNIIENYLFEMNC